MKTCNNKIKILQIMNGATFGGISAVVLNYYRVIDRKIFHFDCAMTDTNLGAHGLELKNLGCEISKLPVKSKNPFLYIKRLYSILKKGKYSAVHIHNNDSSFYPLLIALLAKIPVRVVHAHTARKPKSFYAKLKILFSILFSNLLATKMVACSKEAAISIFGKISLSSKKLIILNNSIDTEKFAFSEEVRKEVRKELKIEDKFALCCVGRMSAEKNHTFSFAVFKSILEKNNNAHLVLAGDGPLRESLETLAHDLNISDSVSFLGNRNDLNRILQGMDSFIMPSHYEGFCVAALEATASGLPIFLSDTIPNVFDFYSKCCYLSLKNPAQHWAEKILDVNESDRTLCYKEVANAGYDLKSSAKLFESIYQTKKTR